MRSVATCLALLLLASVSVIAEDGTHQIVFLSDLHYDGYFGTEKAYPPCNFVGAPWQGLNQCDTSLQLLKATVKDVFTQYNPKHIIITGDFLRHGMNLLRDMDGDAQTFLQDIISVFTEYEGRVLLHPSLAPMFGNDDFLPDYQFVVDQPVHPSVQLVSNVFEKAGMISSVEAQTFGQCAFYAREVGFSNLTLIALNTLVWSEGIVPANQHLPADPCGQLSWLSQQLQIAQAKGRNVYIMSHIPPISSHKTLWQDSMYKAYRSIVEKYIGTIAAELYGHFHKFVMYGPSKDKGIDMPPLFDFPCITRHSFTNPSYMVGTVDAVSSKILTLTQRIWNNSTSQYNEGNQLPSALGMKDLSTKSIKDLVDDMTTDDAKYKTFVTMFNGGDLLGPDESATLLSSSFRSVLLCMMKAKTPKDGKSCGKLHIKPPWTS